MSRPERTLRHFLSHRAPPVVIARPELEARGPALNEGMNSGETPVIISPADGDAMLRTRATFPGDGMPQRVQDREPALSSGWPRLARGGQALGKTSNIRYDHTVTKIQKGIELLRVEGSDLDAVLMCITLKQPAIVYETLAAIDDQALLVGELEVHGLIPQVSP